MAHRIRTNSWVEIHIAWKNLAVVQGVDLGFILVHHFDKDSASNV
ncbi:hypothetical protein CAter282_0226 [Collimonas arenae]|uniref:Uncharacterized protein n=1 Tax=Collimonas arenae TaxID=279058 RepID=A0A127QDA8_9BURK|nr:hypothetical protein CAter10_0239 [Collimonas arenae]AMP08048.1 hypothetical protein CAter282_0226 [Collimonas arenae]